MTSSDTGDAVILLLYGAVVLGAGMRAVRDRTWGKTPFVLGLGIMAYTAAASGQLSQSDAWARAGAPGIFALAMAWLSLILVPGRARERLAVTALLSVIGALGAMHHRDTVDGIRFTLAALATRERLPRRHGWTERADRAPGDGAGDPACGAASRR